MGCDIYGTSIHIHPTLQDLQWDFILKGIQEFDHILEALKMDPELLLLSGKVNII